jgi:uncharacterized protein (TIGR00369 family)
MTMVTDSAPGAGPAGDEAGPPQAEKAGPTGAEIITEFLKHSQFVRHLGIRLVALEPDRAELELPFRDEVITIGDTVHGGAIASLLDTAAMAASWSTDTPPTNMRGTTVGLTVQFLSAARSTSLVARATVLRRGKNLCNVDVDVTTADGELVAKGLVTYKLG